MEKEIILCKTSDILMSDVGKLGREGYTMEFIDRTLVGFYR